MRQRFFVCPWLIQEFPPTISSFPLATVCLPRWSIEIHAADNWIEQLIFHNFAIGHFSSRENEGFLSFFLSLRCAGPGWLVGSVGLVE